MGGPLIDLVNKAESRLEKGPTGFTGSSPSHNVPEPYIPSSVATVIFDLLKSYSAPQLQLKDWYAFVLGMLNALLLQTHLAIMRYRCKEEALMHHVTLFVNLSWENISGQWCLFNLSRNLRNRNGSEFAYWNVRNHKRFVIAFRVSSQIQQADISQFFYIIKAGFCDIFSVTVAYINFHVNYISLVSLYVLIFQAYNFQFPISKRRNQHSMCFLFTHQMHIDSNSVVWIDIF